MRLERMRYLNWAKRAHGDPRVRFNIAASGMAQASAADVGLEPPPSLAIAGPDSFGNLRLRTRLAEMNDVPASHVTTAAGTTQANFLAIGALVRPGDTVLCEWPAYEPLWRVVEAFGARIEWVRRDEETAFVPDLQQIAEGFARGARLLIVSDLHNPSGALLERSWLRELERLARRHDAWVLVDEVYLSGVFDRVVESATTIGGRIVVTSSLTKTYGIGPHRAGWVVAPPAVIERAWEVADYIGVTGSYLGEEAVVRALDVLPALRDRAVRRRAETWPIVREIAVKHGLLTIKPAGGFIAWLRLPKGLDADRFAEHLLEQHGTLVVSGAFFGAPQHVRVGYGAPAEIVREGMTRFERALGQLA